MYRILRPIFFITSLILALQICASTHSVDLTGNTVTYAGETFQLGSNILLLTTDKSSSPYVFNDPLKALEAINNSRSKEVKLFVTPSVYWLDNPDDPEIRVNPDNTSSIPFAAKISCESLSIIGLADNPEDVVFAVNRGQTQGALGNFTMLHFKGKSLRTENMTFGNYCNVDLIYHKNQTLNRPRRRDAIVQAQIGILDGTDKLFARNCRFISRLNLCPLIGARRSLYKDCYFECTDDALTGSAVYLDCRFTFYSGKPFYSTASTGAVFLNCDIHSLVDGVQYLTKVPGMVTVIDTRFTSDSPIKLQWTRDASEKRCYQSNVTLNGVATTIDASRPELSADLSGTRTMNAYKVVNGGKTIYNTPNLLGGNDGWDPLGMLPAIKEAEKDLSLTLTGLPVSLRILSSTRTLAPQGDTLILVTEPRLWGDYPAQAFYTGVKWAAPTTIKLRAAGERSVATSSNNFPRAVKSTISASIPGGLVGATTVNISPYLKEAPSFTSNPSISVAKSVLKAQYTLDDIDNDDSYIVWYRSTRPDAADSVAVRHGHGPTAASYALTQADAGYFISASISPKLTNSKQGDAKIVKFDGEIDQKILRSAPKKEKNLQTSFSEIPIRTGKLGRPGFWHFDTYKPEDTEAHSWNADGTSGWYYGRGADAATGIGLVQASRGARMSYTPVRNECKTMRLSLIAEPCKGPGQGFGSATGQYMDICVKFDPKTLTGYGLRIERTPDYDKAVTFTLVRYTKGKVTPVSESVASNCFRNPCNISLELTDDTFTATAMTDAPASVSTNPDVKPSVNISAKVPALPSQCSFMIQHTGSTGASATLLRDLKVSWE